MEDQPAMDDAPADVPAEAPAERTADPPVAVSDPPSPSLKLEVFGEWMKVPSCIESKVTVMAKLSALARSSPENEEGGESRAPISISAAIDRSGSMKNHLPLLKETLQFMIQQLRPKDQLCLVAFDSEVSTLLPLTAMTAEGKLKAEKAVREVFSGGRTNLSGGLLAALEALYKTKEENASLVESVLLFTDGKANVGIKDKQLINKATKSMLEQINRQVCVFTFGYGSEHDADMLLGIAEAGNGLFYYIDSAESIPDSFCDCLGGLLSVAAQNVKLTFTGCVEAEVSRPVTSYKVSELEGKKSYQVAIHDIYSEEERCILTTITLPADPALQDPTSVAIVTCKVEYFDVLCSRSTDADMAFSLVKNKDLRAPIPSDAKDEIELHQIRCEVASTLERAGSLANAGDFTAARHVLAQAQGRVAASKVSYRPLAQHLAQTIGESIDGMEDSRSYSSHGKAVINNYSQSHWQQRSNATPTYENFEMRSSSSSMSAPGPSRRFTVAGIDSCRPAGATATMPSRHSPPPPPAAPQRPTARPRQAQTVISPYISTAKSSMKTQFKSFSKDL